MNASGLLNEDSLKRPLTPPPPRSLTFQSFWWSFKSLPLQMSPADSGMADHMNRGHCLASAVDREKVDVCGAFNGWLCTCLCIYACVRRPGVYLANCVIFLFFSSIPPATSDGTRQGLESMRGGVCATQGMKVVLKVGQSKFLLSHITLSLSLSLTLTHTHTHTHSPLCAVCVLSERIGPR